MLNKSAKYFSAKKPLQSIMANTAPFFKHLVTSFFSIILLQTAFAQAEDFKVKLSERSKKIVNGLSIKNTARYNKVVSIITNQYYQLNQVHDVYKATVAEAKQNGTEKLIIDKTVADAATQKTAALQNLHKKFLKKLSKKLTTQKIDEVKNGMTYNVFNITYAAYQNMILSLTDTQKQKIYNWLKEARELAMDEGSSDDKHKVFGKYKGKINNYLSDQGYDVKKEGEEWAKRIDTEKKAKQTQN